MIHPDNNNILRNSGCLDFIGAAAVCALKQIEIRQPGALQYLTEEAKECLLNNFHARFSLIYEQALMAELRIFLERHDPVGIMLGKFKPEPARQAAQDMMDAAEGHIEEYLHAKYPLLNGYKEIIYRNYVNCFSDFCEAFLSKKDEISEKLLDGRPITKILHLSTGGADIHRSGRCVIGVKTDAGTVYYKPHDCGLDVLFSEIVGRWFADCTVAPDVVEGRLLSPSSDGRFAFVSCLKHEPVSGLNDIADYYYHFGILAALFHGLGSNDMHQENIISCGRRPACVDMETILGTAVKADTEEISRELMKTQQEISDSLIRTSLLPFRAYKGPLWSPLFSNSEDAPCLPEYDGRFYTAKGYENEFSRGFKEGYGRMLAHRDEITALIDRYENAAVRCLLRNTRFYYLVRQMLFRPEYLSDTDAREKVYAKLCSPYTVHGAEPEVQTTRYEWECILKGDIPYFCTTVSGKDLCGEDPGQKIVKEYYQTSVRESADRFLARLSDDEEAFEQDLIRVVFDHAPTDEEKEDEAEPVPGDTVTDEVLAGEISEMFRNLQKDAIRCTDGSCIWISTAQSMEAMESCGNLSAFADAGMFAACAAKEAVPADAAILAETMCEKIAQYIGRLEEAGQKDELHKVLPSGLYTGVGGVLLACRRMDLAGTEKAGGLTDRIVRLIREHGLYRYKKTNAAEGAAGLILALSSLPKTEDADHCIRAAAKRLAEEELPKRADLPYGCAGIGAALAAAYDRLKDPRFAETAENAFQKVLNDHKPELSGWPNGRARLRFLADKGPHSAGIYLAAAYAKEKLAGCSESADQLTEELCGIAMESLISENTLLHSDSCDEGNSLTVLAFLKAGNRDRAGQILSAMIKRKERKGCFTVTPQGVRSAFDPSFCMGTTGIGYAMVKYIKIKRRFEP